MLAVGDEAGEVAVAGAGLGEQGEVRAVVEGDLGAGDGSDAGGFGGLGELHGAVETVVVGDGERFVPVGDGPRDHLLGEGGAVQEGKCGVEVELGVGHIGPGMNCQQMP